MKIAQIIWILIIISSFGCTGELDTCKKYFQKRYLNANTKHQKIFEEGKINEAISIVEEITNKDSNNYIAINYLGAYKYSLCQKDKCSLEQLKEIYDLYKKSLELCQNYRIGYFNAIEILTELQNTKYQNDSEIIEYLEIYNSRYKKRSNLMAKGGQAMFRLGRIEESLNFLNEAIELDSTESIAFVYKGKCYTNKKDWEKAMKFLNIGLSIDSLSLGFHERGYVNKELENFNEAIQDYKTAILLYNERFESYVGLGEIEVKRNNIEAGCQYFKKAEAIKEESEMVKLWLNKYCNQ